MKHARLNISWLVRTVIVLVLLVGLTHLVHIWQIDRHARGQLARANAAEQQTKPEDVLQSLRRYLSFSPQDRAVRSRYALLLADCARTPRQRWSALQALLLAITHDPANTDIRVAAARLAFELGQTSETIKQVEVVLAKQPERADLLELLACCQIANGQFQKASETLVSALRIAPDRVSTAELLAEILRNRLDRSKQADAILNRLVRDHPRLAQALLARARHYLASERLDLAEKDLKAARDLAPKDVAVLRASALMAERRGQPATASDYWRQALRVDPQREEIYLGLARVERESGRIDQAIATLRAGLKHLPDQTELIFTLADLLIDKGDLEEAQAWRTKLPVTARARSLYLVGRLAQARKQWHQAAKVYTETMEQTNLSTELAGRLMLDLAACYGQLGAHDEQLLAVQHAVRLSPTPRARLELARQLVGIGGAEAALPLLQALARLPNASATVHTLLARALLDQNRRRPAGQRQWSEIQNELVKARRDPAQQTPTAIIESEMLALRGESRTARALLEQAIDKHPDQPSLYLAAANLAAWQGDGPGASALLARGDRAFAGRIDWLLLRADHLASQPGAVVELRQLEARASELAPADRDRFERHLAQLYARAGQHADVQRLCKLLLDRHKKDIHARSLLIDSLLAQKNERVSQLIDELRKLEGPKGTAWRHARVKWLLSQLERGQRTDAAEASTLIEEMNKLRPGWTEPVFLAARLADLEDRPEAALAGYQEVLNRGTFNPLALRRAVQILAAKNRFSEATELLERAQMFGALDNSLLRSAAWLAAQAGAFDRALELANRAVPETSRAPGDLFWRAGILERIGRNTEACEALRTCISLAPDAIEPRLVLIRVLLRQKRQADAEQVLARLEMDLGKRFPLSLARAQELFGRFREAERAYLMVLKREPDDAEALQRLAELYLRTNRPQMAEQVLWATLRPTVLLSLKDRAELRRQLALALSAPEQPEDRVEQALAQLAVNRQQKPNSEADRRVEALVRGRRPAERAAALKTLEALPPVFPEERLRLAQLYAADGRWPQARQQLLELLRADENNPAYMAVLIDGLLRLGKKAEAGGWIEKLQKADPQAPQLADFRERMRRAVAKPGA